MGSNTISGRINEVSIHIGATGTVTRCGGESGSGPGESQLPNIFNMGIGDSGKAKDTPLDGLSATEISCDAPICAGGVAIGPPLRFSSTAADEAWPGIPGNIGTEVGTAALATVGAVGVAVEGNNDVGERATRRRSVGGCCPSSK